MDGILVVNKEKDYTSRDVVNIVGKQLKTKKIGHTGTLDPLATGVLILCIGKATKLVEILTSNEKEYIAEITLGIKTDTWDITGTILEEQDVKMTKKEIMTVLKSMTGNIVQEVPLYSAVKIKGQKLYEYAHQKKEIELPKREVTIKELELLDDVYYRNGKTIFSIRCVVSKGTYIRSLAVDIAKHLNTIGVMSNLKRTRQGQFKIEDSYSLDEIKNNNYQLLSIEDCLDGLFKVVANSNLIAKIKNGAILNNIYKHEIIYFVDNQNKALAIYKTYDSDNTKIKPWKMF